MSPVVIPIKLFSSVNTIIRVSGFSTAHNQTERGLFITDDDLFPRHYRDEFAILNEIPDDYDHLALWWKTCTHETCSRPITRPIDQVPQYNASNHQRGTVFQNMQGRVAARMRSPEKRIPSVPSNSAAVLTRAWETSAIQPS